MTDRSEKPRRAMGSGRARTPLNYGKAIERLRRERGMTRDALAAESGVSPSYLYEVERGYKRPSTDVLANVAQALGQSPSEMLAYIEVMAEALPETPREPSSVAQLDEPRMETPDARREWASSRYSIEPAIDLQQTPLPETGSLRALLAVLEHLSEGDIRILLALARRLAGRGG